MLEGRLHAVTRAAHDFANQSPGQRHRLRIAIKKLRYTAELLGTLYEPAAVRAFVEPLRRLQDDLGYANDVEVGQQIVASLAVQEGTSGKLAETGQRALDWHRQRVAKRATKTEGRLDRLLAAEPFWRG
jgi:CHAD domain-containing protein